MGKKRSAKARQREAERRRQLSQHGVKVMGSNGKPLRTKGGMKKKSSKGSLSLLEKQLGGANPFATKRNAGKSIKLRQRTLLRPSLPGAAPPRRVVPQARVRGGRRAPPPQRAGAGADAAGARHGVRVRQHRLRRGLWRAE